MCKIIENHLSQSKHSEQNYILNAKIKMYKKKDTLIYFGTKE